MRKTKKGKDNTKKERKKKVTKQEDGNERRGQAEDKQKGRIVGVGGSEKKATCSCFRHTEDYCFMDNYKEKHNLT